MTNNRSIRHTLMTALLIGFTGAAAIGGCAGITDEGSGEHGADGEESGTRLTLDQTYDAVRNGARLILRYDAKANAFVGTVQNTTEGTLPMVRVEVHLSNGTELGPTKPEDLAPGADDQGDAERDDHGVHRLDSPPGSGLRKRRGR